jgi:RNA polymerase sigma factor (sigma-70 family)
LVQRWQAGDEDAAAQLFDRYQGKLIPLVASHLNEKLKPRLEADELVQSILKSAFRVTREGQTQFTDDTGFWKWLVTVALNKVFKRIERETAAKRDPQREVRSQGRDVFLADCLSQRPTTAQVVEVADLMEHILKRLDDDQTQALMLKLEGYTQKEIAAKLNVSEKTIQRRSEKIREAAREVVGDSVPPAL